MLSDLDAAALVAKVRFKELELIESLKDKDQSLERYKIEFEAEQKEKTREAEDRKYKRFLIWRITKFIWRHKILALLVILTLFGISKNNLNLYTKYNRAVSLYGSGKYDEAERIFSRIRNYKDSSDYYKLASDASYHQRAQESAENGDYIYAIRLFNNLKGYKNSEEFTVIKQKAYQEAVKLKEKGEFNKAYDIFDALGNYEDSKEKMNSIEVDKMEETYISAIKSMQVGEYEKAISIFNKLGNYKNTTQKLKEVKFLALVNATIGDPVYFGSYEQDNTKSNGKEEIKWLVLDVQGNKLLLISDECLDCKPYNTSEKKVTWNSSTLRQWLNTSFLGNAFTESEQAQILSVKISNHDNSKFGTDGGKDTTDRIFLLSIEEELNYLRSDDFSRFTYWTSYASHQGGSSLKGDYWWLRSPGEDSTKAAVIKFLGKVDESGIPVNESSKAGVRPVMWIELKNE